ncbi:putative triacylglycerol lipase [Phytophthora cinnamomi]|uniref:putative triacylglycerol lipase n=1 Tax=Phytophthora cinnamomi TaxID=4785 RepID=UPI00355A353A|nr:putative triacylglycerol lipase [Phytophthora cinnamomi]
MTQSSSLRTPRFLLQCAILFALTTPVVLSLEQAADVEEVRLDPDVGKSTVELIKARGYAAETHNVTTADGYILTLHRLPKSYAESQSGEAAVDNKPAILVQHGLLDSSFSWVCNFRNQSLAFVLADAGYDVWLGNNRGNTYSDHHVKYTTEDDEFWDFSWQDMGRFDLPAMLNHVVQVSGQDTVALVGHSEGTTQAFVAFSENQTLAQSVSYFAALAPVAWLSNTKAKALKFVAKIYLDKIFEILGQVEFLSQNEVLQEIIGASACTLDPQLCETALALVSGDSENWNSSRVGVYLSEMPAGTSVKNMAHYAQSIRKDTFSAYNYGCSCLRLLGIKLCSRHICKNKAKYGTFDPPAFPVANIKYPRTGFFRGENDILATAVDIDKLRNAMPLSTVVYDVRISDFSHMDFTWAVNANEKIYQSLLDQLETYVGVGY